MVSLHLPRSPRREVHTSLLHVDQFSMLREMIFSKGSHRWYRDELVWMATLATLERQLLLFYGGRTQDPKSDLAKAQ